MLFLKSHRKIFVGAVVFFSLVSVAAIAGATHSWGGYHWARTANPFTLKLGDNVSLAWDAYLTNASVDWNKPSAYTTVLSTTIVPGQVNPKNCRATSGRVEVCSSTYGKTGWLGIASIWASGSHITQGTVKLNDTYFSTAKYNTPAWRQFVACQEIGHTFGLDHQDTNFTNLNLGTCMDYTNDPDGTLYNELNNTHPNAHDYEELAIIYTHLDAFTTLLSKTSAAAAAADDVDTSNPAEWGRVVKKSANGRAVLYERDLGSGEKIFTFVLWAENYRDFSEGVR